MNAQGRTFLRAIRTAAWGFLGLRRRGANQDDFAHLRASHVILAGLLLGSAFVLLLLLAVHLVTA